MKKHYFILLSILLSILFCSNAYAERLAYGFVIDDSYGSGDKFLCSFNINLAEDGVTKVQDFQGFKPMTAAYAEDTYYLIAQDAARKTYLQKVSLLGDKEYEKIGDPLTVTSFVDMTYDIKTHTMYAISPSFSTSDLYTVDLTSGILTKKATLNNKYHSMACSPDGQLYGITWLGKFIKINLEGENATETPIKDSLTSLEDGSLNQSLDFDTETNTLYWIYTDGGSYESFLYKLDPATGEISDKKTLPNGEEIIGLCFAEVNSGKPDPKPDPDLNTREAFGFSLTEEADKPTPFSANKAEFRSFNANAVQDGTKSVQQYALLNIPQAASYVNDKDSIYFIGQDAEGFFLYRMDKNGGNYSRVGTGNTKISDLTFKDMAYDPMNKTLYGIADSSKEENINKGSYLYSFNLETGVAINKINFDDKYLAMAILPSGQAMGITEGGEFCIIYVKGGMKEKISSIDSSLYNATSPMDMEFDLSTLTLYWSYTDKDGQGHMATIDPATGKISNNNTFKNGEQVIGLYFPTIDAKPTATWYAFSMFSNTHDEDNGFITFDPANLVSVTPIGKFNTESIAAATGANGIYYAVKTTPYGYGAKTTDLATVNLENGTMANIKSMENEPLLWDITYDYSTATMYAISMEGEPDPQFVGSLLNTYCKLYSMDMESYELKAIAKLDTEYRGIACTMDGQLYALTQQGELRKLNKLTGAYETVMETGIIVEPTFPASMEFDHATEALYCTYFTQANKETREASKAAMSQFDYASKKVTDTRIFPGRDKLCGLYIPFERSASIPAKVTDFTVTPGDNGALTALLSWKNPTKNNGNEDLTAITKTEISRDGAVIATLTEEQTPGKQNTYTDEPTIGFHNYVVRIYNGEEASEPSAIFKYIGEDVPAAPTNVTLTVDGAHAAITWEAPTIGLNTGWFNPDNLKYKIIRQPDNKTLQIDYKGNSITDEVPMMNYYTYEVTAYSTKGEGGAGISNSATAGNPFTPPYSCDFMNDAEAGLWTLNGSWIVGYFGMGENYCGLIHQWEKECNSWAYSPLIQFKNDKSYVLSFKARSGLLGPKILERLQITVGQDRTPESQTVPVAVIDSIGGGNKELVTYSVIFNVPAKDNYYLGFYCNSFEEINDEGDIERTYGELQISNITLLEIPFASVKSNEIMNDVFVYANESKIYINGEYSSVTIYNQLGTVCPLNTNLTTGIYFVKVIKENVAKTYKVLVK